MIFNKFNQEDIVTGRINKVSSGVFGSNLYISQSTFVTQSQGTELTGANELDVKNGQYYVDTYIGNQQYFSITYGDYVNSGSSKYNDPSEGANGIYTNETKVIYTQYKNTLLQPGDKKFTFASGSSSTLQDSEAIFVINFSSDKILDQLDEGQLQINFKGSNGEYSYIDDSSIVNREQSVYNLISGSVINGVPTPYTKNNNPVYEGIGLFYPKTGNVVFNAINLDEKVGINNEIKDRASYPNSTSTEVDGYWRVWSRDLYQSLVDSTKTMAARKSENVPASHYFVRVKNRDFNYSNNPTFVSDGTDDKTKGTIIYQDLISSPKTYITAVGLYNDNNELLAVGKLSKPTQKTFDNELLIKVKLDY